jgi:hypothetical protein
MQAEYALENRRSDLRHSSHELSGPAFGRPHFSQFGFGLGVIDSRHDRHISYPSDASRSLLQQAHLGGNSILTKLFRISVAVIMTNKKARNLSSGLFYFRRLYFCYVGSLFAFRALFDLELDLLAFL